jgi:tetratricopeptide (TPR) repeat protein/predicted Ser/Thr protein kinase
MLDPLHPDDWLRFSSDTADRGDPGPTLPSYCPTQIGPYEALTEIGRGGMGIVFKAWDGRLGRFVALKMLPSGLQATQSARKRLLTEASLLARLTHPDIIRVYDVGEQGGVSYLAMEFVEGEQLQHRLREGPALTVKQVAQWGESIARAVHHAHLQGVLHRDLKPANILLQQEGDGSLRPRVADFGIARLFEHEQHSTQSSHLVGTPAYMAPEVLDGSVGSSPPPSVDLYALGVMLYEMLTARTPHAGQSLAELMLVTNFHEPIPPGRWRAGIPRDLETIVLKCLERKPTDRYASAEALADDLRRFQENRPVKARPLGSVIRAWRWMCNNPLPASLLGLLATAIALLVVVLAIGLKTTQSERDKAIAARADAERRTMQTRHTLDLMTSTLFDDLLGRQPEFHSGHRAFLEQAREGYAQLAADSPDDAGTAAALARLGTIERRLGLLASAEKNYRAAIALYDKLEPLEQGDRPRGQAAVHANLGALLADLQRDQEALHELALARDHLASLEQAQEKPEPRITQLYATVLATRGRIFRGRLSAAEGELQEARQRQERLLALEPNHLEYRLDLASTRLAQGALALFQKQPSVAKGHLRDGLALLTSRKGDQQRPEVADLRAAIHLHLGNLLQEEGRTSDGQQELTRATETAERLVQEYPVVMRYRVRLASCLAAQANLEKYRNRKGALETLNRAVRLLDSVESSWHQERNYLQSVRVIYHNRAFIHGGLGQFDEALKDLQRATDAGSPEERAELHPLRLMLLIEGKRHEAAIAEGHTRLNDPDLSAEMAHDLARLLAIGRLRPTTPSTWHAKYNQVALQLLTRAAQAGYYRKASTRQLLLTDKAFALLRSLPDWQQLLARLSPNDTTKDF